MFDKLVFLFLSLGIGFVSCQLSFQCFDESERVTLTYVNNASKPLDEGLLPTIRLFQGVYGSQWAIQWTVYVYITELMGVNASWFPSEDPYVFYDSSFQMETIYGGYPDYYFTSMRYDVSDLLLELWPLQRQKGHLNDYILDGYIIDGGFSGAYAETGWFIPSFLVDLIPLSIVPYYLRNKSDLRKEFIDVSATYIDYIRNVTGNTFPFDTPTNDTPIIVGSSHGYIMSEYSYNLTRNMFDYTGVNWSFVSLGSESALSDLMVDLYQRRQPFLANLYGPHIDFGTVINESTAEIMEFQRVALPRNPSNTVNEQCYIEAQCAQPIDTLTKIANARLADTFPEMITFMQNFEMSASDVNSILLKQKALSEENTDVSDADLWAMAACEWIKESRSAVDQWYVNIERYDCGANGCGFTMNGTTNIGGYCDESSGECICSSDQLTGRCRTSCPGLIGPIWNTDIHDYTFEACSAHGICNIDTLTCTPELGWGNDDCSYQYQLFIYNASLQWIFTALFIAMAIVWAVSLGWLIAHREYIMVKALSVNMSAIFTVGMIAICVGSIFELLQKNNFVCNFGQYCLLMGIALALISPLLKAYRVAVIFEVAIKKLTVPNVSDTDLLKFMLPALGIELLLLVGYTIFSSTNGGVETVYNDELLRIEYQCNGHSMTTIVSNTNWIYLLTLLVIFTVISYKTRVAAKLYQEIQCSFFGSFGTVFAVSVIFVFRGFARDISQIITAQSVITLIINGFIWGLFYGRTILKFREGGEGETAQTAFGNRDSMRAPGNHPTQTIRVTVRSPALAPTCSTISDPTSSTQMTISSAHNSPVGGKAMSSIRDKLETEMQMNDATNTTSAQESSAFDP